MNVQLSKKSMIPKADNHLLLIIPICRVWKQSKSGWQYVPHEIDDPCLKSIMVSKPEIHWMTINFSGHTPNWWDFIMQHLHMLLTSLRWTIFWLSGFIQRRRSIDRATLSLCDATDKQTFWLVNVTFDWRQIMATAVQRYSRTHCLITFLHCVFCTINIEFSQFIHRNYLKIKCKYKS